MTLTPKTWTYILFEQRHLLNKQNPENNEKKKKNEKK